MYFCIPLLTLVAHQVTLSLLLCHPYDLLNQYGRVKREAQGALTPNHAQAHIQSLSIEGMFVVSTEELLLDYSIICQGLGG